MMDLEAMLKELRDELEMVNVAILSMERLAAGPGKRRGRPPAWMKSTNGATSQVGPKAKPGRPSKSKEPPGLY